MKKITAIISAMALIAGSVPMYANAYSWESDRGEMSYDHKSDVLDWSLWEDFLKYDLRITDFDSLDTEKQNLCKFIYETEMMSEETIVCERARRIVSGEDVGERLTVEQVQQYELFGEDTWIYGAGGFDTKYYYNAEDDTYSSEMYYKYKDNFVLFSVPDIKHMAWNKPYNEYWLDDEGKERITYKGELYTPSGTNDYTGSSFTYIDSNNKSTSIDFMNDFEYKVIKSNGLVFSVYPDNTLCLTGIDYNHLSYIDYSSSNGSYRDRRVQIPNELNGMPVTRIGSGAFKDYPFEKIILIDNIEYIEPFAFDNCKNLEEVLFTAKAGPADIKNIAPFAFNECHNLGKLEINSPDMTISYVAFRNCDIKELKINAKSVPYFSMDSPNVKTNIDKVNILSGVREIDAQYLIDGTEIPESVKVISGHIYEDAIDVTIPEHIEILGAYDEIGPGYAGGLAFDPSVPLLDEEYNMFKYCDGICIFGKSGTEAENYALRHNIKFIPIEDNDTDVDDKDDDDGTISGYYNSAEHKYAIENNIKFIPLDDIDYGDTNRDGEINIADAVLLKQYLFDSENYAVTFEADVNQDGVVDVFDMVYMRKLLIG
ncbi:MAG: leucine-rich repeat protein [Ruminococcus sp.]|nr:leucine-rich repeat protein [Ruminococcus sp.]